MNQIVKLLRLVNSHITLLFREIDQLRKSLTI